MMAAFIVQWSRSTSTLTEGCWGVRPAEMHAKYIGQAAEELLLEMVPLVVCDRLWTLKA
jgi:hypothetical protein